MFKGTRRTYEDRWSIDVAADGQAAVYAVFDGHNGPWTADYLRQHLGPAVLAHPEVLTSPEVALASAFAEADEGILAVQRESLGRHSGSTAVVCRPATDAADQARAHPRARERARARMRARACGVGF